MVWADRSCRYGPWHPGGRSVKPWTENESTERGSSNTDSGFSECGLSSARECHMVNKMQWILQTRKTMSGQWPAEEVEVGVPSHRSLQAALIVLDHLHVQATGKGCSKVSERIVQERNASCVGGDQSPLTLLRRGWKLFMMLPRMLLHRPPRGGLIPRHKLVHLFEMFSRGEWWDPQFVPVQHVMSRRQRVAVAGGDIQAMIWSPGQLERRCWSIWWNSLPQDRRWRGLPSPGSNQTLTTFSDLAKPLPVLRNPILDEVLHHVPGSLFQLDEDRLIKILRSAWRGAAGICAFCSTTSEIRSCSSEHANRWRQAKVPNPIIAAIRVGRMTVLRKPDGGVRGTVAGDVVRRRIAHTMA